LNKHREFGLDAAKFVYLPNPVSVDNVAASPQGGGYFLYFGRISRETGVRTLIAALSRVKTGLPLYIAGEGPDRNDVEEMALEQLQDRVQFTGYLTGEALVKAIDAARAVILPSEWYENAPMTILESFTRGKPVIGARIGGIPEMIDDGVNGYLFEPGNTADLQKKLEMFLDLPAQTVVEMGLAARKKVENEYSAEAHYGRLMNVYRSALEK
jgi:glycosyltransferase involved in cell wall biosynthesis